MHLILAAAFLFLKTGEKFATQETAGPTLAEFTNALGADEPQALNDPAKAFDLVEGTKGGAGVVLMEEGTWKVIAKDDELGPKLKAAFTGEELPGALVVVFGPNVAKIDASKFKNADKQLLASIRVEAFVDVDQERLKKAQALFNAK